MFGLKQLLGVIWDGDPDSFKSDEPTRRPTRSELEAENDNLRRRLREERERRDEVG